MAYTAKRIKPSHLHIIRLSWQGETNHDIAMMVGVTPQTVSNVLGSPQAQEILEALQNETIDTMSIVQADAQHVAPVIFDQLYRLAMTSGDERVRKAACTDILSIAGHVPIRKISVERNSNVDNPYEGKSLDDLRKMVFDELNAPAPNPPKAPDGSVIQ